MAAQDFQRRTIFRQIRPGRMIAYRGIESLDGSRMLVLAHTVATTGYKKGSEGFTQTTFASLDLQKQMFFTDWDQAIAAYNIANPKLVQWAAKK